MPKFDKNKPVEVRTRRVKVDSGLPVGIYKFQLVVVDADGVASDPVVREVRVLEGPGPGPIG